MINTFKKSLFFVAACLLASTVWAKDPTTVLDVSTEAASNAYYSLDALPSIKDLTWVGYNSTGSGSGGCISASHWKLSNSRTLTFKVKNCSKVEAVDSYFSKDATTNLNYAIDGGAATSFATNGTLKKTCASGEFLTNNTGEITIVLSADNDVALNEIRFYPAGAVGPVAVTGVTLNKTETSIEAGQTEQLTATVAPDNAANKNVTWSSDKTSVATVDQNGVVSALSAGTANITVTTEDGGKTATCAVTVTAPAAPIEVTAISLTDASVAVGGTTTLTVVYTPSDANTGKAITSWTSSNTGVATVDNGVVTGITAGTSTITATTEGGKSASCTVTVTVVEVTGVSLDKPSLNLQIGGKETLTATIAPSNASNKELTWSSSNASIASVSNGVVTGVSAGTATITVASVAKPTITATCEVTVTAGPPVPSTDLIIHVPEVYEAETMYGGYGGTLTILNGREYEVYYTERTAEGDYPTFAVAPAKDGKSNGISGSKEAKKNVGKEGDTWFEGTITEHSGCDKKYASSVDEFVYEEKNIREHRLSSSDKYQFHVKGFDQFSLWGMDKKIDPKNGNQVFVVKVDGVEQTTEYSTDKYTVRRYNITSGEHLIEISTTAATGTNKCVFGGFSLRLAQEPRTKWLYGNDSTQTVLQTTAPEPIHYFTKYNSLGETKLEWDGAEGTGFTLAVDKHGDIGDTLVLGGVANCPVGTYNYRVVSYYNGIATSSVPGKIKVASDIIAVSDTIVEAFKGEQMDQMEFRYYALSASDVTVTWEGGNAPDGITGQGVNGRYIISGTPTTVGDYKFVISVPGGSNIQGRIIVSEVDLGNNPVLYLYKNSLAYENDGVFQYLKNTKHLNLIPRKASKDGLRGADQYAKYKWVLISEDADADNAEVLAVTRDGANLPVLNMKSFSYAPSRLGWGEPDNGSLTDNGRSIIVQRDDHPIFQTLNKKKGDKIAILSEIDKKGLMPADINLPGTFCLATSLTRAKDDYYGDGVQQTFLHEVPASMRGGKKYICMPIALSSSTHLSSAGKQLLDAVVNYLLSSEPSSLVIPTLQITSFVIDGEAGVIDESKNTIHVDIDTYYHEQINKEAIAPLIGIASDYTHVTPASEEVIDLSQSIFYPIAYEVSDYINRRVYEVSVRFFSSEGIEDVYASGDWVNIYDIFGRKVSTTNEDIYRMELPRGVYVVVTETGATFKIMR